MDFVTREEFEALEKRVVGLESKIAPEKEKIYMRPLFGDDPTGPPEMPVAPRVLEV